MKETNPAYFLALRSLDEKLSLSTTLDWMRLLQPPCSPTVILGELEKRCSDLVYTKMPEETPFIYVLLKKALQEHSWRKLDSTVTDLCAWAGAEWITTPRSTDRVRLSPLAERLSHAFSSKESVNLEPWLEYVSLPQMVQAIREGIQDSRQNKYRTDLNTLSPEEVLTELLLGENVKGLERACKMGFTFNASEPLVRHLRTVDHWQLFLTHGGDPFKKITCTLGETAHTDLPFWKALLCRYPSNELAHTIELWATTHVPDSVSDHRREQYFKALGARRYGGTKVEISKALRSHEDWTSLVDERGRTPLMYVAMNRPDILENLPSKAHATLAVNDKDGLTLWPYLYLHKESTLKGLLKRLKPHLPPVPDKEGRGWWGQMAHICTHTPHFMACNSNLSTLFKNTRSYGGTSSSTLLDTLSDLDMEHATIASLLWGEPHNKDAPQAALFFMEKIYVHGSSEQAPALGDYARWIAKHNLEVAPAWHTAFAYWSSLSSAVVDDASFHYHLARTVPLTGLPQELKEHVKESMNDHAVPHRMEAWLARENMYHDAAVLTSTLPTEESTLSRPRVRM